MTKDMEVGKQKSLFSTETSANHSHMNVSFPFLETQMIVSVALYFSNEHEDLWIRLKRSLRNTTTCYTIQQQSPMFAALLVQSP